MDVTLLALGVKSDEVTKGYVELDKLTKAADRAERSADDNAKAQTRQGESVRGMSAASQAAQAQVERLAAAQQKNAERTARATEEFMRQLGQMQQARVAIAAVGRALDSVGGQNRDIARAILGTRSTRDIANEINLVTQALASLRANASVGPLELARASEAARIKVAALKNELNGINPANLRNLGDAATPLPGILRAMIAPIAAVASIQGIGNLAGQFYELADANVSLQARLKATTGSAEGGRAAFAGLVEDAKRLRVPIEDAGTGFVRLAASVIELGGTVKHARQLNEVVLATAKIMGVSGAEAASAARQFAQALGSGVLQGDELRSILENNQELARQLAAGLGVGIGELKKLGAEGKLTADVVSQALLTRLPEIQQKMRDVPITVADAYTLLKNEVFLFAGALDKSTGSSRTYATGLEGVAGALKLIREEFADGNIIKGMTAVGLLTQGRFGAIGEQASKREYWRSDDTDRNDRQAARLTEEAEKAALGVKAAFKRAYDSAAEAAEDSYTRQQKITAAFGEQMQKYHAAIELANKAVANSTGAERIANENKLNELLKMRSASMTDVVKKLKEANDADAKKAASANKLTAEQKAFNKEFERTADLFDDVTEHGKRYDQAVSDLNYQYAHGSLSLFEWIAGHNKAYDTLSLVKKKTDELAEKSLKAYEDAMRRNGEALADSVTKIEEQAAAEEMRARNFGRTESELTSLTIAQEEYNLAVLRSDDYEQASAAAIEARIAALKRLRTAQSNIEGQEASTKAIDAQKAKYKEFVDYADQITSDLWAALTDKGGNAFQKITEIAKNTLFALLYKMTLQPFVVNVAAQISGMGSGGVSGIAGMLGQFFGGGSGGGATVGSGGGSYDENGMWSAGAGGGSITSTLGLLGTTVSMFSGGLAAAGTAIAGFAAGTVGATAMLAATIPVVGWIAAAGLALYAVLGKKGGGPKAGGFASVGDITGITNTDSTGRWFTPNDKDADVQKIVDATSKSFAELMRSFGAKGSASFALGFDSDPQGTADNRVHAGTFVNGVQVYNGDPSGLGRDGEALSAAIELEAKRSLLAALQASELPQYLADLFDSVNVDTASAEDVDGIIATAQALRAAVELMGELGGNLAALNPEQVKGLVEAFGGLEQFAAGFTAIQNVLVLDDAKLATMTEKLGDAFASLGVTVPKTHADFLKLLNGLDLTSAADQQLYASLTALLPAFAAVYGTAQQAADEAEALAEKEAELTRQRRAAIDAADDFFRANFYNEQEQAAMSMADNWSTVHGVWTEFGEQLMEMGLTHIPTSMAAFRQLVEGIDRSTVAGESLYLALLELAPAIFRINEGIKAVINTVGSGEIFAASQTLFDAIMQKLQGLVDSSDGNFGEKISLMLSLIPEQIAKAKAQMAYYESIGQGGTSEWQKWADVLAKLQVQMQYNSALLARYTVLSAQFDAERAAQLVELEQWYHAQAALLAGDPDALAALYVIFKDKWDAIVAGTEEGVEGVINELEKLRENLKAYLAGLLLGNLSPLSPMAKLEEAKRQYEEQLKLAQGGDLEALANISKYADAYLAIAREVFGSTSQYNAIFDQIVTALTLLTIPPSTGGTEPIVVVAGAMPVGSPIASQADLQSLGNVVADLLVELIDSNAVEAQTETLATGLQSIKYAARSLKLK